MRPYIFFTPALCLFGLPLLLLAGHGCSACTIWLGGGGGGGGGGLAAAAADALAGFTLRE